MLGAYGADIVFELTRRVRLLDLTSEDTGRWLWNTVSRGMVAQYVYIIYELLVFTPRDERFIWRASVH